MSRKNPKIYRIEDSPDQDIRIERHLDLLDLIGARHSYRRLINELDKGVMTTRDFAENLLESECDWKNMKRVNNWLGTASFPLPVTINDFNFEFPKKINKATILEVYSLRFIKDGINVIIKGPTAVGKTHLAVAVGRHAIDEGKDIRFYRLQALASLVAKTRGNSEKLNRLFSPLVKVDLLILDDMRAPIKPFVPDVCDLLYEVLIQRYDVGLATMITTRREFDGWDRIFGDWDSASAVITRLGRSKIIIEIDGEPYGMQEPEEKTEIDVGIPKGLLS